MLGKEAPEIGEINTTGDTAMIALAALIAVLPLGRCPSRVVAGKFPGD